MYHKGILSLDIDNLQVGNKDQKSKKRPLLLQGPVVLQLL